MTFLFRVKCHPIWPSKWPVTSSRSVQFIAQCDEWLNSGSKYHSMGTWSVKGNRERTLSWLANPFCCPFAAFFQLWSWAQNRQRWALVWKTEQKAIFTYWSFICEDSLWARKPWNLTLRYMAINWAQFCSMSFMHIHSISKTRSNHRYIISFIMFDLSPLNI